MHMFVAILVCFFAMDHALLMAEDAQQYDLAQETMNTTGNNQKKAANNSMSVDISSVDDESSGTYYNSEYAKQHQDSADKPLTDKDIMDVVQQYFLEKNGRRCKQLSLRCATGTLDTESDEDLDEFRCKDKIRSFLLLQGVWAGFFGAAFVVLMDRGEHCWRFMGGLFVVIAAAVIVFQYAYY